MTREEAKKIALDNIKQGIEKDGENALFCAMPRPGKNSWTLKEALEAIENPAYGDVYQVTNAGTGKSNAEFVYVENAGSGSAGWVELGTVVDLSGYAPLASPVFTGTPTAPTPLTSDDSTTIATTAFVHDVADAAQQAAETASDPAGSAAAAESAAKTYADGLVTWGTF